MGYADKRFLFPEFSRIVNQAEPEEDINQALADMARQHGFTGLLHAAASRSNYALKDNTVASRLRNHALLSEATAIVRREALIELLGQADEQGLSLLLMKGIPLAYQVYLSPGLRTSSDIDVFIDEAQMPQVVKMLAELGYAADVPEERSTISFQFSATKLSNTGHTIVLDLHLRINNQAEFEQFFEFSRVYRNAVLVPQISACAKALSYADAYVFACVHLQGHFLSGDPIKAIWLYDIHLLLEAMNESDVGQAAEIIKSGPIGSVCEYWTAIVVANFATEVPLLLNGCFAEIRQQLGTKTSMKVNPLKLLWDQFKFMPNNKSRLIFLRQLLLPPIDRIREKYPNSTLWPPLLYIRRAISGFWCRLTKIGR